MAKVLVGEDLVEDAVGVPRRAATDEFAISRTERVEDCVVEFLIIGHEVKFIRIDYIKRRASDCFGVVGESLNAATVDKMDLRFLWFKDNACG